MKFRRTYSAPGDPYAGLTFEPRTSRIVNPDGGIVFEAKDVMVPATWSQVATDVLAQKYCRKAGVPTKGRRVPEDGVPQWLWRTEPDDGAEFGGEHDAREVFHRLAGCWTYWGFKHGYFDSEGDAQIYYGEMCAMLARQIGAPNSPQWFNTGLHWAYGIAGPAQGHYYVDPKTKELTRSVNAYEHPAPHACFIQSVNDDLVNEGGIMDLWVREARIFKFGSGTGSNFSKIRGEGERLSGGGTSSGLMSFLRVGDRAAGAIKSGGTTRRAAKMVCLDLDHPDVEDFILWKVKEEQKVSDLVAGSITCERHLNAIMKAAHDERIPEAARLDPALNVTLRAAIRAALTAGIPQANVQYALDFAKQGYKELKIETYDVNWDSKAYGTVSGQNSNNSVRVPNSFFDKLDNNEEWQLRERTNGTVSKNIPAPQLWEDIALSAWQCADPGVQYDTTINEWHTCASDGRINASNPCSEYMFLDDTACNLASMNLVKFEDAKGEFDAKCFADACRFWTFTLEISVLMAQFPSRDIAQKSYDYRTLGLGYANLGTLLMRMGLPYDSEEAFGWCAAITSLMTGTAYHCSAEMAQQFGAFARYEQNWDSMLRVIRNHRRAAYHADDSEYEKLSIRPVAHAPILFTEKTWALARKMWDEALAVGEVSGFRNAQTTVIAPTGCLTGDSLVTTDRGMIRLDRLGDINGSKWQDANFRVLTDDGEQRATKFFVNGIDSTRRLTTKSGYAIQGTLTHRIKVINTTTGDAEWKRLADVKSNDIVPLSMSNLIGARQVVNLPDVAEEYWTGDYTTRVPRVMNADLAELIGYFMGDGSFHSKGLRFCVSQDDFDVADHLVLLIRRLFNLEAKISQAAGYIDVSVHSVPLTLWWEACGFRKRPPPRRTTQARDTFHIFRTRY